MTDRREDTMGTTGTPGTAGASKASDTEEPVGSAGTPESERVPEPGPEDETGSAPPPQDGRYR
jgi:hypothetical protein